MKKPYSLRHNTRRNSTGAPFWAYGVVALVVVLLIALRVFLPGTFVVVSLPFWKVGTSLSANIGTTFAGFESKEKLDQQNAALAMQVATLKNENQVLTARSQDLTKLLGGQTSIGNEMLAGVLAGPPESPYDSLIVSAGSSDGVTNDALVYSAGGIPIGTVSQVNANTSRVSLFSTPGRGTSGWVGENRIPVTLTGMGAGAFTATVSASTTVAVGDIVYVPGPGALPIGTVIRVDRDPSSPTPVIQVQPLVNLFSITWVEVSRSS
jgi:cell shape-determining protein MreC